VRSASRSFAIRSRSATAFSCARSLSRSAFFAAAIPCSSSTMRALVVDALERLLPLRVGSLRFLLGPARQTLGLAHDLALGLGLRLVRLRLLVGVVEVGNDRLHEAGRERAVFFPCAGEQRPGEIARGVLRFEEQRGDGRAAALGVDGGFERRRLELAPQRAVELRRHLGVGRVVVDERIRELPHGERVEPRALGRRAETADQLSQHVLGNADDDEGRLLVFAERSEQPHGTTRSRPPP
jgi:hypothetical protein